MDRTGIVVIGCGFVWLAPAHAADEPGVIHRISSLDDLLEMVV